MVKSIDEHRRQETGKARRPTVESLTAGTNRLSVTLYCFRPSDNTAWLPGAVDRGGRHEMMTSRHVMSGIPWPVTSPRHELVVSSLFVGFSVSFHDVTHSERSVSGQLVTLTSRWTMFIRYYCYWSSLHCTEETGCLICWHVRPAIHRSVTHSNTLYTCDDLQNTNNFWHPGTLTLCPDRQSAWMSKITHDGLTRSGTG